MKCPKCGSVQFPQVTTCRDCGFRMASWSVRPPPAAPAAASNAIPAPAKEASSAALFGEVPCPHCGTDITSSYGPANAAVPFLGLAGALMLMPFVARYECANHGKLGLFDFSGASLRVLLLRRVLLFFTGVAVLVAAVAILVTLRT